MTEGKEVQLLLQGFRALDLTDEKGFLCGKILGDLGAEVIKVEKPGGDDSRHIGPFFHDIPDAEKSLYWFAFNNNKKGITLDIRTATGQDIFKRLVKISDFVIESFAPRYLDGIGLGYSMLSDLNPRIIMTSITGFGQSGPRKDYRISELVSMAMGGTMYINGEPTREPLSYSFPHAYLLASAGAASGTLFALYNRGVTGQGQHVDESIQQAVTSTLHNTLPWWDMEKQIVRRTGRLYKMTPHSPLPGGRAIWPCKDGYVCYILFAGRFGARFNPPLVEWMEEDGIAVDFLKQVKWESMSLLEVPAEVVAKFSQCLTEFFMKHTKAELRDGASKRHIIFMPVNNIKDITEDPQLTARGFWQPVQYPELGTAIVHPGGIANIPERPIGIRCRAPLIGEHNENIYIDLLGLTRQELVTLRAVNII